MLLKKALRGKQYSIPSFFVPLPFDRFNIDLVRKLIYFLLEHTTVSQSPKYVLKFPFVTNSEGLKFFKSFPELFDLLFIANSKYVIKTNRLPYAIVQPCLINRMEKKCILLNGRFQYFAANHVKSGRQYKFAESNHLSAIAETYLKELVRECPGTIASGHVRVDLMSYNDNIVVNEFESLEAMYCPENPSKDSNKESITYSFLVNYWAQILSNRVFEALN